MRPEPKTCPTCGQRVMRNHHSFSRAMANLILKTAEAYEPYEPFRLKEFLTHVEINNFQKLAYFGLVEKHHNTKGERLFGKWALTLRAWRLIRGEERIESWVETFNNQVVERSPERIGIADTIGTYRIPADYAKEQRPAQENKETQAEFEVL